MHPGVFLLKTGVKFAVFSRGLKCVLTQLCHSVSCNFFSPKSALKAFSEYKILLECIFLQNKDNVHARADGDDDIAFPTELFN